MHIPYWHYARESEFSGQNLEMGSSDLFLNYCAQLPLLGWGAMGGVGGSKNLEVLLHW